MDIIRRNVKAALLFAVLLCVTSAAKAHEKESLNMGWRFLREDVASASEKNFDDSRWRIVNLPHDAQIEDEFTEKGNGASARNGFLKLGKGWYRKHLTWNENWRGKHIWIEFEGVYRDARIYINGKKLTGEHPNGYVPFACDITKYLEEGDNVIAVGYDNTYEKSSRWYNGEGINRNVWLIAYDDLHVERNGTYITTPKIFSDKAKACIETKVRNDGNDSIICRLITEIYSPNGELVASKSAVVPFGGNETYTFRQELWIENPQLWEVGDGKLYDVVSHVERLSSIKENKTSALCDVYKSRFGIRDIEFSPDCGLLVNGKRVYINGVCLHTDLGPLGTASFDKAWEHRLAVIKNQMGCNGIRLSHNCYPEYVLDWADENGVLVFEEFFDKWDESFYGKGVKCGDMHLRDIKEQMERDRNHPSVFIWSVGNEVYYQIRMDKTENGGVELLKKLYDFAHNIDASRKITVGQYPNRLGSVTKKNNAKKFAIAEPHQFEYYSDIVSTNYLERFWDSDHEKYPQLIFMASELAVGDFGYDYFNYDHSYPVGHFYWGGTDYIGESFGWPYKGWTRGLVDITNRVKPLGQSVRSFYTETPMTKIVTIPHKGGGGLVWNDLKMTWKPLAEHWNYNEGDTITVQVMSNCDETELFLNGKSLGKKQLPEKTKAPQLAWEVPFEKGELKAIGYRNGHKMAEDIICTAGKAAKIVVKTDDKKLKANGMDLAYLDYEILDKDGNVCHEDVSLQFDVNGCAEIIGIANSNMATEESFRANPHKTFGGRCQLILRSTNRVGKIKVTAKAKGMKSVTTILNAEK